VEERHKKSVKLGERAILQIHETQQQNNLKNLSLASVLIISPCNHKYIQGEAINKGMSYPTFKPQSFTKIKLKNSERHNAIAKKTY
jgi:hypothetical protein